MRRFLVSFILLSFGWLAQMPAIHAFDVEQMRDGMTQGKIVENQKEFACENATCCYESAPTDNIFLSSTSNKVSSPILHTYVRPVTKNLLDSFHDFQSFHKTNPSKQLALGGFAALVGIVKKTN